MNLLLTIEQIIQRVDDGIEIKSDKDITIKAGNKINMTGDSGIGITSSGGDVSVNAVNIKETADAQYSAKGGASTRIEGGSDLTLKGAMVMIN